MTANTAQRVAVETDERLVFVDACGDMLRKLGKPIMGRELKATAETLALEVERLLELASQITTDWIPANRKLAERAEAAESKLAEQAAEIERLKFVVLERNRRAEAAERAREEVARAIDWYADNQGMVVKCGKQWFAVVGNRDDVEPFDNGLDAIIAAFLAANG